MKYILGNKVSMTQLFDESGKVNPATIISAGPITALQVKTKEKDGYEAVQWGLGERKEKNIAKPQKGQFKDLGNFRFVKEYRARGSEKIEAEKGAKVDASIFAVGDTVEVTGISKGRGFQGVVKRHGFHGGPRSHGQKHSEREAGSIGGGGGRAGGRVAKGMRMAGRMGQDRVTVKNLKVLAVDKENNLLYISGAVPGRRGTLLEVRSS
ncbi:50S ribosomal protein L3 [bacterium]|nr:50S ribosomal protein L3 [bacterium]